MESSISIVDWLGKMKDGVGVLLSLKIDEKVYEIGYWFNPNNEYRIVMDKNFINDYKIIDIYKYKGLKDLITHIHTNVLPPANEVFSQFDL